MSLSQYAGAFLIFLGLALDSIFKQRHVKLNLIQTQKDPQLRKLSIAILWMNIVGVVLVLAPRILEKIL